MLKDLQTVLETQHRLLDALLLESLRLASGLDLEAFEAFRETLRQHVALEERVILKALRDVGFAYPLAPRIHEDHGEFGRLIAAPPTVETAVELGRLLQPHEELEESEVGLFAVCMRTLDEATLRRLALEAPLKRSGPSLGALQPQTREDAFQLAAARLASREPDEG